jgi:hypothetical protein
MQRRSARETTKDSHVYPQPPETGILKIDKDCVVDRHWIQDYVQLILTVCGWFKVQVYRIRMCPSAHKGQHFYIDITPPIPARLANRIHYLLGDDCQRVAFNMARIEIGQAGWSKLFECINVKLRTIYRSKVRRGTKKVGKGGELSG